MHGGAMVNQDDAAGSAVESERHTNAAHSASLAVAIVVATIALLGAAIAGHFVARRAKPAVECDASLGWDTTDGALAAAPSLEVTPRAVSTICADTTDGEAQSSVDTADGTPRLRRKNLVVVLAAPHPTAFKWRTYTYLESTCTSI